MVMISKIKDFAYERLWNIRNRSYPPPTPEQIRDKRIRIFVITHTDKDLPPIFDNRDVYVPLRVGNAVRPTARKDWMVDDVGENISSYNPLVNEMTGIWWVAKHYEEIGNPDYVGFTHYRRFLQWTPSLLTEKCFITTSGTSIHRISRLIEHVPLQVFRDEMVKRFPREIMELYDQYWNSHTMCLCNLFIAERSVFVLYYHFIDKILNMVFEMNQRNVVDFTNRDAYAQRVYGFFCEWMLGFFVYWAKRKGYINHVATMSDFFSIPNLENSVR